MSVHRITRLVFLLEGVVVSPDPDVKIQPEMTGVLNKLYHRFELWLVSNCDPEQVAAIISKNSLAQWFNDGAVYSLPEQIGSHDAWPVRMRVSAATSLVVPRPARQPRANRLQ